MKKTKKANRSGGTRNLLDNLLESNGYNKPYKPYRGLTPPTLLQRIRRFFGR